LIGLVKGQFQSPEGKSVVSAVQFPFCCTLLKMAQSHTSYSQA